MGEKQYLIPDHSNFLNFPQSRKVEILEHSISYFSTLKIVPIIGLEFEFYLQESPENLDFPSDQFEEKIQKFLSNFQNNCKNNSLIIEKEQGFGQIEIKTQPSSQIPKLCKEFLIIKKTVTKLAKNLSLISNFKAQPFLNDCGSALQINLSFKDENDQNLFAKNISDENQITLNSIAGILNLAEQLLIFSAPKSEDYLRYNPELNSKLFKNKKYPAPTNVSWGYNNRTALVRIPTANEKERRLEFRLPSANADIYLVISTLLLAVKYGIENDLKPEAAIFGNAFDEKYQLQALAGSYDLALENFLKPNPIRNELLKVLK